MVGVSSKGHVKKEFLTLGMAAGRVSTFLYAALQYGIQALEKTVFELILTELFA